MPKKTVKPMLMPTVPNSQKSKKTTKKSATPMVNGNQPMMGQPQPSKKKHVPMVGKAPMPGTKTPTDKNAAILIKIIGKKAPAKVNTAAPTKKAKKKTNKVGK